MVALSAFGWTANLPACDQRAAVQVALNTGEAIEMPGIDPVTIDGPLVMSKPTTLTGNGNSRFIMANPTADILTIKADRCRARGIQFLRSAPGDGQAVVVGPKADGSFAIYVKLEDLEVDVSNRIGVHAAKFGGLTIQGGRIAGREAALLWYNEVVDSGDSKILGVDINADNDIGAGLWWKSGGGVYIAHNKFNQGRNHIRIDHDRGHTGSIMVQDNSLEGNAAISIDIRLSQYFNRLHIQNNSIGVRHCAIAVRNFNVGYNDAGYPHLHGLMIDGNTIEAGFDGSPLMDIGCCTNPLIGPNTFQGRGAGAVGAVIRPQCVGGKFDQSRSTFTGCSPEVVNLSSTLTVH